MYCPPSGSTRIIYLGTGDDPDFARYHGAGGEWRVDKQRLRWDILDAFAQAAHEAGIPRSSDFNRGNNDGVGYFEVNQKNGWRWNSAKAFLRPACHRRRNFKLWTHAHVARLNVTVQSDGRRRCTGAQVWDGREMTAVHAAREVILCAGSIGSPQILQLSGIGPADLLRQQGIDVILDAPGVGANLQDHLQIRAVYKIDGAPTLNVLAASLYGKARMGLEYLLKRTGPHEHGAFAVGRLYPQFAGKTLAGPRIPCAAAVARCIRRAAARVSRVHGKRVQSESDQPRHGAHQVTPLRHRTGHRAPTI